VTPARPLDDEELKALYADAYAGEPFIELASSAPGVRDVRDTNFCRIHVARSADGRVLCFAAIDNLWKGAAGQAVQNMNVMLGMEETLGLGAAPAAAGAPR
jgi:N-acetyl-gamma-glutamyl-phosphate reductase